MKQFIKKIVTNKHHLATVALIVGFLVDLITFRTINISLAQIILSAHLFIVAGAILIGALPMPQKKRSFFSVVRSWTPVAHQYSTGNLLSAFLILYSASASFTASWPFLVLVAVAAVGNEVIRLRKYKLPFDVGLFLLNLILFFTLAVPIALGSIGVFTFLASLLVSAIVFQMFRRTLRFIAKETYIKNKKSIGVVSGFVFSLIAVLYITNIIPPIPLAVKDIDFYHFVERSGDTYRVHDEARGFLDSFFDIGGTELRLTNEEHAYVFTAVFAPADLDTDIVHRWEFYEEGTQQWVTGNIVAFPIVGGRQGGYRGFSFTEAPTPGKWRVSVETESGQTVGRAYLTVKRVNTPVPQDTIHIF